jgi:hypothetical protein
MWSRRAFGSSVAVYRLRLQRADSFDGGLDASD